jgi:hypothetical protein
VIAATWGTGQVLLDILWFFLFVIEIWLMIVIFSDLFRRHDIKGWVKALWVLLIIVLPLLGILLYLIVYGSEMRYHAMKDAEAQQRWAQNYLRDLGGSSSPASELMKLQELRERGVISEEEFQTLKSRIVKG